MATPSFFGSEFVVNTTTAGFQSNPSITGLANGKFVAAWQDDSLADAGGFASIRTQLYNADGSKLGGEFIANGNEVSSSIQPTVTALEDGRYVVAWTNLSAGDAGDGSGSSVKGRVFNANGSPAGNEFFINSVTPLDQGEVSISALADGGFAASWSHDFGNGDLDIHGRIFNADGTPRSNEVSIDASPGLELNSTTAGLAGGGFVSVWTDSGGGDETDGDGTHIRAQRFDANGADVGDEFVVNFATADDQSDPTVVALANGGFAVAWTHRFDANDTDTILRIFNASGIPQTQDVFIDDDFNTNEDSVSMVALPDGNLFVAWRDAGGGGESDGSGAHIRGKVISGVTGKDVSDEIVINTTVPLDQLQPSVTALADGRVVVSWTDNSRQGSAAQSDVRAQIIDPRTAAVNLIGSNAVDDWVGTGFADTMASTGGNDVLDGKGGDDILSGGGGADTMKGGLGNDLHVVEDAGDVVIESANQGSADTVQTLLKAYTLTANVERLFFGGSGNFVGAGNELDNIMLGGASIDVLDGKGGNDFLDGLAGADTMKGGLGNDIYRVDSVGDVVTEGVNQGFDIVDTTLNAYTLKANVERVNFVGSGNFVGAGNALDNRFAGGAGDDRFVTSAGADIYGGGGGVDAVDYRTATTGAVLNFATAAFAGAAAGDSFGSIEKFLGSSTAADVMVGSSAGNFVFAGFGGADKLTGGTKTDQLLGGDGNDVLSGLAGKDTLIGDAGNDTMTGGADGDVFVYAAAGFGKDLITDWQDGLDKFKVDNAVADALADFKVTGNGTADVTLSLVADPTQTITLHGAAAFTITAADFVFV